MKTFKLAAIILAGVSSMASSIAYAQDGEIIMRRPLPNMGGVSFDPETTPDPDGPTDPTGPGDPTNCTGPGSIPGSGCDEDPGEPDPPGGPGFYEWVAGEWSTTNPVCGEPTVMTRTVSCMTFDPMGGPIPIGGEPIPIGGEPIPIGGEPIEGPPPMAMEPADEAFCWAYAPPPPATRYEGTQAGCVHEFAIIGYEDPGQPVDTEIGTFYAGWNMPPGCQADNMSMPIYECRLNGEPADMSYCWSDITNGGMPVGQILDMYMNDAIEGGNCNSASWVESYDYVGCQGTQEIAIRNAYCIDADGQILDDESRCTTPHGFGPEGPVTIGSCSAKFDVPYQRQNFHTYCTGPLIGNQDDNIAAGVEFRQFVRTNDPLNKKVISDWCTANEATCCEYRAIDMDFYDPGSQIIGNIRAFRDPDAETNYYYASPSTSEAYNGADDSLELSPDDPNARDSLPYYEEPYFPNCPSFDPFCDDEGPVIIG